MVPVRVYNTFAGMVPVESVSETGTCPKVAVNSASAMKWPEVADASVPFGLVTLWTYTPVAAAVVGRGT